MPCPIRQGLIRFHACFAPIRPAISLHCGRLFRTIQAPRVGAQRYTVYFNKRHGRSGHVFEQRYKAMVVDRDNYLLQVSRYIHLNPVSAKAADRPQHYRWSKNHGDK